MLERIANLLQHLANCGQYVLALLHTYSGTLWVRQRLRRPHIVVLAYNRVTPDAELGACAFPDMHVSTTHFEKQLVALKSLYRVVTMSELQRLVASGETLRENLAVITFDCGYRDNFEHAFEILERHDVSATFFLSTGFVDDRRSPWFDRLADIVARWDAKPDARRELRSAMPSRLAAIFESAGPRRARLRRAMAFLDSLPFHDRRAIMKRLTSSADVALERPAARALRWSDVEEMAHRGMSFGTLGVTLTSFTHLSVDQALREMRYSMGRVEERVGESVTVFAYPNGVVEEDVLARASEVGLRMAFTLERRDNRPGDDPYRLGRRTMRQSMSVGPRGRFSRARFWCEISGSFDMLTRVRRASSPSSGLDLQTLDWTAPPDRVRPIEAPAAALDPAPPSFVPRHGEMLPPSELPSRHTSVSSM